VFTPDGVSNAYLYRDLAVELQKKGHRVTVLTTTPHYNVISEENEKQPISKKCGGLFFTSSIGDVSVIHIPMFKKSSSILSRIISAFWFHIWVIIIGLIKIERQDIVISSSPPLSAGIIGSFLAHIWNAPSVYIVQDVFPDGLIRQGKIRSKALIRLLKKMERIVYNVNDKVVVIGDSFYETLLPRVTKKNKLCLIENFVDIELYKPLQRHNAVSLKYNLDDIFVVSYVGNIGNGQDFSPVIYAAERLKSLPIKFVFAGDGIKRRKLEKEIEEKRLSNVILLGYVPRDITPLINASSDVSLVLLSPHIKGDGFPSKIFSIMACARTAIVTADDGSDLKRVLLESGCGRVVPVGNNEAFLASVIMAYEERDILKSEGERARKYVVQNYSKQAIAIKYEKMIKELCVESINNA
jgi:colanic acid biosynthesis glycosyl transferase WcaI